MGLKLRLLRLYARAMRGLRPADRIWLYTGSPDSADNAFRQFRHDLEQKDGMARYYICENPDKLEASTDERRRVVAFGSWKHKLLYLRCGKILTSFCRFSAIHPFGRETARALPTRFEVICLRHEQTEEPRQREGFPCDRMVISTELERLDLVTNYGFGVKELIEAADHKALRDALV